MAKTTVELDYLLARFGIKRGNRRTKPSTFTEVELSSLTKQQVDNRDCTGWPTGQHVILTEPCDANSYSKVKKNWLLLTSKDSEQPCTQRLYIPEGNGDYMCIDASGKEVGEKGSLESFFKLHGGDMPSSTYKYLAAIRTKPFILLAGISGTGKSRLVRQLARGCCPDGHKLGKNAEGNANSAKKPGNFEMIPVRPNWHDSTELMGYVTRLTGDNKPKYVIKPFVKFLVKAAIWKDVPFFLCLDEMNLAPVEQYFAEYLSVVETRKKDGDDIVSDVLVNFDQPEIDVEKTVQELMAAWIDVTKNEEGEIVVTEKAEFPGAKVVYDSIVADKGVRIPKNFIVMGTVNMDETTCSFSRKVLDRAMTFELNEVNMDEGLKEDNSIPYGSIPVDQALATAVEGCDFYSANKDICDLVKTYLEDVNEQLDNTPFKFAYRSRNEIMLYCIERCKDGIVDLAQALDEATSMKVLSRIEGDAQKLEYVGEVADFKNMNILQVLQQVIPVALKKVNGDAEPVNCSRCVKKLKFMERRLNSGFTNFFV